MSHSMSDHCKASLRVNETLAMSGEQAADTAPEKAKKVALLYLGGLPAGQNATAELPVAVGITGCISRLQVSAVQTCNFDFIKLMVLRHHYMFLLYCYNLPTD